MILYISTYENNKAINEAIVEMNLNIMNSLIVETFDLLSYIKQSLGQFQSLTKLIIDLSALNDNENEIYQALETFRIVYDNVQIIIVSPNKKAGDHLLAQIFNMGIYDIIEKDNFENDVELLKNEIILSIKNKRSFKDSIRFKESSSSSDQTKVNREKIVIKREIKQSVNKALIGVVGTRESIGVTHNVIVFGNYLTKHGYKVAIVENKEHERKCFEDIENGFEDAVINEEGFFTLNNIDYYSNYDLAEIHKILAKNYNFVIIDFGMFKKEYLIEFYRCVIQIVVCGIKPWEISGINMIFENCHESEFKEFTYLFNFTDKKNVNEIKENMTDIKKIYFTEYTPDPFHSNNYSDLNEIFKDYGDKEISEEKKVFEKIYEKIFKKEKT